MDVVCFCDGLSPLPVEEKAVSWTWLAFAMAFSPCPYRHPGITRVTLKIAFSSYLTRKKAISMLRVFRQAVGDNPSPYRHPWITRAHLKIDFSTYLTRKSNTGRPRLDYKL